jgi:hypothetical protein
MDSQGDTLYSEDIKKIFTSFNNQDNFEIYHEDNPIPEVSLLENYISTADETLGTAVVPSGSWNVVIRVDNPEIQQGLLTGELGGLSLSNRIAPRCKGNLKGTIRYQDVPDAECVVPRFISFVKGGANGYGLHVYDYDAYILKSKDVEFEEENGGKRMDFKEFWKSLKSLIEEVEAPEEEAPAIEKEDEETEEEVEVEATATEEETEEAADETETEEEPAVEKEDTTAEEEESEEEAPAIEKEDNEEETDETAESEDEETDEAEITKEDEEVAGETDLEARVAKLEEIVAALTTEEEVEEESETPDPEIEPEDEDTPKITKSEKVVITDKTIPETLNYYQMSGRDPLTGKKIRN